MASIRNLTGVFALMNRKMVHRASFRFGIFIGYGFGVMILRLLANAWTVLTVFRHHPDYDYSGFFTASLALVAFYGICVIPLIGARSANGILGHPRLSHVSTWRLAVAHTLFTVSRLPFLILAAALALYSAGFSATAGVGAGRIAEGAALFTFSLVCFAIANIAFHRIFHRLSIRLPEAETVLLALVVLAVFLNPQPVFRDGTVTLSVAETLRGAGYPDSGAATVFLIQPVLVLIDAIALSALHLLGRLETFARRKVLRQAFARLVFGRLPLSLLAGTAFAEWYIFAWPAETWIKVLLAGGIALYTLVRAADAFVGATGDIFELFRRRADARLFLPPAFTCAAFLVAPILLHLVFASFG